MGDETLHQAPLRISTAVLAELIGLPVEAEIVGATFDRASGAVDLIVQHPEIAATPAPVPLSGEFKQQRDPLHIACVWKQGDRIVAATRLPRK